MEGTDKYTNFQQKDRPSPTFNSAVISLFKNLINSPLSPSLLLPFPAYFPSSFPLTGLPGLATIGDVLSLTTT